MSEPTLVQRVNSWADDEDDTCIISLNYGQYKIPKTLAIQLADQLYLLTKTRP